jgi:hypothetical protein
MIDFFSHSSKVIISRVSRLGRTGGLDQESRFSRDGASPMLVSVNLLSQSLNHLLCMPQLACPDLWQGPSDHCTARRLFITVL